MADADSPFYRALATKYDLEREDEALEILEANPEIATLEWPGPDKGGQPFIKGATLLHYAANDGKLPQSSDALHAPAWGGSSGGEDESIDYPAAIEMLVAAGADLNPALGGDYKSTPLAVANESSNTRAIATIEKLGGSS